MVSALHGHLIFVTMYPRGVLGADILYRCQDAPGRSAATSARRDGPRGALAAPSCTKLATHCDVSGLPSAQALILYRLVRVETQASRTALVGARG